MAATTDPQLCPVCGVPLTVGGICELCGYMTTVILEGSTARGYGWSSPALTAAPPPPTLPSAPPPPAQPRMITLRRSFSYVHEPFSAEAQGVPTLGGRGSIEELLARLLHSRGGTFLITGFRGVGKTTSVMRTLEEAGRILRPDTELIPVVLNVGRPISTDQLLFAVVRRLFELLDDRGILMRLPPETRQSLLLAYLRTSMSFKQTQARTSEHAAALDLGGAGTVALPKLGLSAKRTRSAATEAAFLAYSQTDVEYDLVRIVRLVNGEGDTPFAGPRPGPGWRRPGRRRAQRPQVKLVVVLDELDKLTSSADGFAGLERMLAEIKNVLAMPGVHFLLVAGVELHDAVVKDAARGNGVYESVVAWRQYIPCSWDAADSLVTRLVETLHDPSDGPVVAQLAQYLRFKARGVLRRLFQEFNALVAWPLQTPHLRLTAEDQERVAFYAKLQTILDDYLRLESDKPLFSLAIDEDRWRLGTYYLVDWVLRSGSLPISAADALRAVEEQEIDPLLRLTQREAARLLSHLADHDVLDEITTSVIIGDVREATLPTYKLAADVKSSLLDLARESEQERANLFLSVAEPLTSPGSARSEPPGRLVGGRYEVVDLIGRGGLGAVYRGVDSLTGRPVAIKMIAITTSDPVPRARFAREARISAGLDSPRIVRVYDVVGTGEDPDDPQAIVMEYIEGPTLDELLRAGTLDPPRVAGVAIAVGEALGYLDAHGINRIDVKPSNIVIHPSRGAVVIDLGIARRLEPDADEYSTAVPVLIGTPAYMAPEQFSDRGDIRSDIYSLGCTMYACLTGKPPFDGGLIADRFTKNLDLSGLPGSPELRVALAKATATDPDHRYSTPAELLRALRSTPEGRRIAA
jgi:serine/threonine-protein kinase